jgi:hypothetical protein
MYAMVYINYEIDTLKVNIILSFFEVVSSNATFPLFLYNYHHRSHNNAFPLFNKKC